MNFRISNFVTFVDTDGTASIIDGNYIIYLNQWYKQGKC